MRPLLWLLLPLLMWGEEEFSFDAGTFEKKRFDLQGYLRSDNALQYYRTPSERIARSSNELNVQGFWDDAPINLHADASLFYRDDSHSDSEDDAVLNALTQRFGDERQNVELGKKVLRWGKGYAYSSLAFFERTKDPIYPDLSREGFWMAQGQMTRTPAEGLISAYTLDLLYLPDTDANRDHFASTDSRVGAKLYMLAAQTDIDIVVAENGFGADFSADVGGGLELHGEWGRKKGLQSALAGLRYQSTSDLTLIAEWFRAYDEKRYRYLKITQKEPLGWVYSSLYILWLDQEQSPDYRSLAGGTYDFKNGFTLDLAYVRTDKSDGAKAILYYYF
jgi:hypothetical protein